MLIRPHDLLFLTGKASLRDSLAPLIDGFWQPASMPVVVRRDAHNADWIPIGLRGRTDRTDKQIGRKRRCAACTETGRSGVQLHPRKFAFTGLACRSSSPEDPASPCSGQMGITGSCGFSLAWGCSVMRASSDLDLVVNASLPLDKDEMRDWLQSFRNLLVGIDVQISTPSGGFALREWLLRDAVLLKPIPVPY